MASTVVIDALINGEMHDLLRGKSGYVIPDRFLDTPTESTEVFFGILEHFGNSATTLKEMLDEVMLMSKEPDYAWFSAYYLYCLINYRSKINYDFDLQQYCDEALGNIRAQESHLRNLKKWAGSSDPDGCWGYVDRLVQQFKTKFDSVDFKVNW